MSFSLPKVTDIEIEVDGRLIKGAYSVMLGTLVVYYNGRTASIAKPEANLQETAIQMLQELVHKHFIPISRVPVELPEPMRVAVAAYVNSFDDDELIRQLILSFGPATIGSLAHTRVSYLCVNALQPIVPCWKAVCDDDAAEQVLAQLHGWLHDPSQIVDWETMRQPLVAYRNGIKIEDCDACAMEPIANALVSCADYLQTATVDSAVKTIAAVWSAQNEGCWPEDEERSYEEWLIEVALPNAYRSQTIK